MPKTVARQRRGCDLNSGLSAPESSTLTTLYRPTLLKYSTVLAYCGKVQMQMIPETLCHDTFLSQMTLLVKTFSTKDSITKHSNYWAFVEYTTIEPITDLTQSVFKRYHSDKHFSEFLPTRRRQKINWHRCGIKLRHCHPM